MGTSWQLSNDKGEHSHRVVFYRDERLLCMNADTISGGHSRLRIKRYSGTVLKTPGSIFATPALTFNPDLIVALRISTISHQHHLYCQTVSDV
jgi:hypothetical protein